MGDSSPSLTGAVAAEAIDRICSSQGFRRSARLQHFLRFLASVEAGTGCGPKEYEIAREVYGKPEDFNPQIDPIIRVEAGRLRLRLAEYYGEAGRDDTVMVELPRGSYVIRYRHRNEHRVAVPALRNGGRRQDYLRGRYFWSRRTAESLREAIACFRRAIDEDCLDAAAWSGLADCYLVMGSFEYMRPDVVLPRAVAAARKALELEPRLAEAHCSLAAASAFETCDSESAFGGFKRAIELNPEYASAWHFYGVVLLGHGLYDRALEALQTAQTLDPLSPIFSVQLASLHFLRREFGRAASLCDDLIRMDPDFWPARWFGGMALEQLGRAKEAVRYLELAIQSSQRCHWPLGALGHVFASTGFEERAVAIARELEQRRDSEHCSAAAIALVYAGLRRFDHALHWLHTARLERSPFCAMFLLGDPRLDCVRSDPRMQSIVAALSAAPPV